MEWTACCGAIILSAGKVTDDVHAVYSSNTPRYYVSNEFSCWWLHELWWILYVGLQCAGERVVKNSRSWGTERVRMYPPQREWNMSVTFIVVLFLQIINKTVSKGEYVMNPLPGGGGGGRLKIRWAKNAAKCQGLNPSTPYPTINWHLLCTSLSGMTRWSGLLTKLHSQPCLYVLPMKCYGSKLRELVRISG